MDTFTSQFKALSDLTRLRLLRMILSANEKICVCELADALELPQYQVSKHLAVLRQAGLVSDSRVGTWVYYSTSAEAPPFTMHLYDLVRKQVNGPIFEDDNLRLKSRLELRQDGRCVLGTDKSKSRERREQ